MRKRLFTPGPLTTSDDVRNAMTVDWGSRDADFTKLTARVRSSLTELVNGVETHETVLMQGAGTFAVEAAIATLVGPTDPLLVLINGEYGRRIEKIAEILGKPCEVLTFNELEPVPTAEVASYLQKNQHIRKVALVQLETTTGVLNPYAEIAQICSDANCDLLLDAMSGFACYPVDVQALPCAAVIASSNKGLHGAPGVGFVIADRELLARCEGNCRSLSLDLYDQSRGFQKTGQWRFTPPTHCLAALDQALAEFQAQGGQPARRKRYEENAAYVLERLGALGFNCLVEEKDRSAVILTFGYPDGDWFDFASLYDQLASKGHYLYPGKLTKQQSFRIGCIGALDRTDFDEMLDAFETAVKQMTPALV